MSRVYFAICGFLLASPAFSSDCLDDSRQVLFSAEEAFRAELARYPLLPEEEQHDLLSQYAQTKDREVANKLVQHNLRLVFKIASRYRRRHAGHFMDLVQEGSLGLFEAVKRYEPDRGAKFLTYAYHYVKGYIRKYIYRKLKLVPVKISAGIQATFMDIKKELSLQGKNIFDEREQVAGELGVSVDTVVYMNLQLRRNNEIALAGPFEGGEMPLTEILPYADAPFESALPVADPIFRKTLARFLRTYSKRDRDILLKRRLAAIPSTGPELAAVYGISKQRVEQVEKAMMAALKEYVGSFERSRLP